MTTKSQAGQQSDVTHYSSPLALRVAEMSATMLADAQRIRAMDYSRYSTVFFHGMQLEVAADIIERAHRATAAKS